MSTDLPQYTSSNVNIAQPYGYRN